MVVEMLAWPIRCHECGQADAGAHHIRGKGVPEAVRMGGGSVAEAAVMAEQGTHPAGVMRAPRAGPFNETNSGGHSAVERSSRR